MPVYAASCHEAFTGHHLKMNRMKRGGFSFEGNCLSHLTVGYNVANDT